MGRQTKAQGPDPAQSPSQSGPRMVQESACFDMSRSSFYLKCTSGLFVGHWNSFIFPLQNIVRPPTRCEGEWTGPLLKKFAGPSSQASFAPLWPGRLPGETMPSPDSSGQRMAELGGGPRGHLAHPPSGQGSQLQHPWQVAIQPCLVPPPLFQGSVSLQEGPRVLLLHARLQRLRLRGERPPRPPPPCSVGGRDPRLHLDPHLPLPPCQARLYPPSVWVGTRVSDGSAYLPALIHGFWRLFRYIQGKNAAGAHIPMTGPVLTRVRDDPESREFEIYFMLPEAFRGDPPAPTEETVFIERFPELRVFARVFGGWITDTNRLAQLRYLDGQLSAHGHLLQAGRHYTAGYNSPMEILNRRNEVWRVAEGELSCSPTLQE
uniref:Heme-binding protein 2-like n=1 Tax=Podarcis muralis TaxID=64176 RepID=A0A670HQ98_PODMU